tara:strand:- start:28760 stop:29872 length:1113 start_codon:yes stop_codon:yes gene_type:complete
LQNKKIVTFIIGTRPEAIKLAPVILEFKSYELFETRIVLTGQHNEMVQQIMSKFNLIDNINLNLMRKKQSLANITSKILINLESEFDQFKPELVVVQGDTSSAFSAALLAFYKKIKIAHVEAGLRTNVLLNPFPEEANRRLISKIATLHFAPTNIALENLKKENINEKIFLTGNTGIDALLLISKKISNFTIKGENLLKKKLILVTIHRRENWGKNVENICEAINRLTLIFNDVIFLIPMHKNPIVRDSIINLLENNNKVILKEAMDYEQLVSAMKTCYLILTDSGGIQEEAPSFRKPVLVLRENTERCEAIDAGIAKLVGTNISSIEKVTSTLLTNKKEYNKMISDHNPFGDGKASKRILKHCIQEIFE